jgi:hypothetical protein
MDYDMAELVVCAPEPALRYPKDSPLAGWLVHACFNLFPNADWTSYLLATPFTWVPLWLAGGCSRIFSIPKSGCSR